MPPRFAIYLNGRHVCEIGIDGYGVRCATVIWADLGPLPSSQYDEQEWASLCKKHYNNQVTLAVGGFDGSPLDNEMLSVDHTPQKTR